MARHRGVHEAFSRFFEKPSRELLRDVLRDNGGERSNLDFKTTWPAHSDIARHILGMLNSGGGCIVVGVSEQDDGTLVPTGLISLTDKADIEKAVRKFLPQEVRDQLSVLDFAYDASEYAELVGKRFQVLFVDYDPLLSPVVACANSTGLKDGAIYIRRLASTEEANHSEVKELIRRHIEAAVAVRPMLDVKLHLKELRALYDEVPAYRDGVVYGEALQGLFGRNPLAPKESFQQYVVKLIEKKKKKIESELNI